MVPASPPPKLVPAVPKVDGMLKPVTPVFEPWTTPTMQSNDDLLGSVNTIALLESSVEELAFFQGELSMACNVAHMFLAAIPKVRLFSFMLIESAASISGILQGGLQLLRLHYYNTCASRLFSAQMEGSKMPEVSQLPSFFSCNLPGSFGIGPAPEPISPASTFCKHANKFRCLRRVSSARAA